MPEITFLINPKEIENPLSIEDIASDIYPGLPATVA